MTGAHGEILAGTWDAVNSRFIVTDGNNRMFGVTIGGAFTVLNASVGPNFKGLAFVGTTLYGVTRDPAAGISTINPTTGVVLTTTAVTAPALTETPVGFNGLATNPATGVLWAILRTTTNVRRVGTITPAGVFTSVAVIADNFAGIAFDAAVLPPTISKAFGAAQITVGQTTSLTFTLKNPNTFSLTGVGFTDTFPAGIATAVPVTTTNSCSGGHAGTTGSTSLTGGTIAAGGTCVVTVNMTGTTVGVKNNITSTVGSTNGGTGGTASASITVVAPVVAPTIAKIFGAAVFPINTNTNLNFLASNGNAFPITVSFTDTLPAGLVVANPSGAGNNCGGTVSAVPLSNLISFTGTVPANSSCQVALLVTGTTPGVKDNTSSAITSLEAGTGNVATASTIVALPPVIIKLFSVAVLPLNGVTTLLFNMRNTNASNVLTGVGFTDNLPAGLKVATPSVITNSCSGTVTAVAGSGTISLTGGGPLAPASSCTVTAQVTGVATGLQVNVTDPVTSIEGGTGNTATASITIGGNFLVSYAANLTSGDSVINLTNTGANGALLSGPGIGGAAGNICVNVYAFSPDEQLISCCSCPITPNGLSSLSVKNDLINNTLTGVKPNSVIVKLVVTGAGATFTGTTCANSAAVAGQNVANPLLATGGLAFGTTLHALDAGFVVTENPFRGATLSAQELASITNRCTNIIGNGSGFGVCKSCRPGGLDNTNR